MTTKDRTLPVYDWRALDSGRSMRLLSDGHWMATSAPGYFKCSCGGWGRSMDADTARHTADAHAEMKHGRPSR